MKTARKANFCSKFQPIPLKGYPITKKDPEYDYSEGKTIKPTL